MSDSTVGIGSLKLISTCVWLTRNPEVTRAIDKNSEPARERSVKNKK